MKFTKNEKNIIIVAVEIFQKEFKNSILDFITTKKKDRKKYVEVHDQCNDILKKFKQIKPK